MEGGDVLNHSRGYRFTRLISLYDNYLLIKLPYNFPPLPYIPPSPLILLLPPPFTGIP